jgi:hypothetical protein
MQHSVVESPGLFSSQEYVGTAEIVFHRPHVPYSWDDVIMCAVGQNSFRGALFLLSKRSDESSSFNARIGIERKRCHGI